MKFSIGQTVKMTRNTLSVFTIHSFNEQTNEVCILDSTRLPKIVSQTDLVSYTAPVTIRESMLVKEFDLLTEVWCVQGTTFFKSSEDMMSAVIFQGRRLSRFNFYTVNVSGFKDEIDYEAPVDSIRVATSAEVKDICNTIMRSI